MTSKRTYPYPLKNFMEWLDTISCIHYKVQPFMDGWDCIVYVENKVFFANCEENKWEVYDMCDTSINYPLVRSTSVDEVIAFFDGQIDDL